MEGTGRLLLAEDEVRAFSAGEVARFSEGEIHERWQQPVRLHSRHVAAINFDHAYGR
jgi:hypothetical protein